MDDGACLVNDYSMDDGAFVMVVLGVIDGTLAAASLALCSI